MVFQAPPTHYASMPLKENLPEPKEGWELKNCPVCGCECWETPQGREGVEKWGAVGMRLALVCTACMLRLGERTGTGSSVSMTPYDPARVEQAKTYMESLIGQNLTGASVVIYCWKPEAVDAVRLLWADNPDHREWIDATLFPRLLWSPPPGPVQTDPKTAH